MNKGTYKNAIRHAELVSASPENKEIAGQARNDASVKNIVFRNSHKILLYIMTFFFFTGCDKEDACDIFKTRGEQIVEHRSLPNFNTIKIGNGINVFITNGDDNSVKIEGWKNLMPKIILSVNEEGVLEVDDKNTFNFVRNRDNRTTLHLSVSGEINCIDFSGDGVVVSNDTIHTAGLTILSLKASGSVDLKVNAQWISIGTSHENVASITLSGFGESVGITHWGYNPVDLSGLGASHASIHHHGPANVYVNTSETLEVVVYGVGNVYYRGNPKITLTREGKGNLYKF